MERNIDKPLSGAATESRQFEMLREYDCAEVQPTCYVEKYLRPTVSADFRITSRRKSAWLVRRWQFACKRRNRFAAKWRQTGAKYVAGEAVHSPLVGYA